MCPLRHVPASCPAQTHACSQPCTQSISLQACKRAHTSAHHACTRGRLSRVYSYLHTNHIHATHRCLLLHACTCASSQPTHFPSKHALMWVPDTRRQAHNTCVCILQAGTQYMCVYPLRCAYDSSMHTFLTYTHPHAQESMCSLRDNQLQTLIPSA